MVKNELKDALASRYEFVQRVISYIKKNITSLPEGRVRILRRNSDVYYYSVVDGDDNNGKIVPKDNTRLARGLAQRTYWEDVLKVALQEERLIRKLIDRYPDSVVEEVYETLSQDRQELVTPVIPTDQQYVEKWLSQEFRHKGFKEGMPFYTTIKGERVRSKSEQIIADRLTAKNIPYIYEKPLPVGNDIFHPDFTILRMSDRKELYLEHLGRLGEMGYATDAVNRINKYHRNGFVLGDNLFLTGETAEMPFDVRTLDKLIEQKFL